MVLRYIKFSQSYFLILLHASTLEQCCYIKNPNNDLKILQNSHLKSQKIFMNIEKTEAAKGSVL